jgi:C-terminal processing protease CtpA/Prc
MDKFLNIHPSDGYNITGKYHRIERRFSQYFTNFIDNSFSKFSIEVLNPTNNEIRTFDTIASLNYKQFTKSQKEILEKYPNYSYKEVSSIKIENDVKTATITFNDFSPDEYEDGRNGFKKLLENYFKSISDNKIENLIIDIRKNEGGDQGMEDHLLSYLISKEYLKYKYVEIPSFTFSFLNYTTYTTKKSQDDFENNLREEFFLDTDGRYLNKKETYKGDKPKENNFKGNIYILINGLTFSGGSEFAALAKNYTNAKFIGEETGGGYYGNTSGDFVNFILPNTGLTGRIPICKIVIEPKVNNIPFGRGVLPDYKTQPTIEEYLNDFDAEMEFTKKLISK